jgi:hypothetical protein
MKAKLIIPFVLAAMASSSFGVTVGLFEWAVNIDGTVSDSLVPDPVPGGANFSSFDYSGAAPTGLGTVVLTVSGAGSHYLGLFVDHEVDETVNTFFNEYGSTSGTAASGQSWEIDEPGYTFGDIFANFSASGLDNSNGVPSGSDDDVSMALGWDFSLAAGETATATVLLGTSAPSGFYLQHTDPDSDASVYFSSSLRIGSAGVPEGGYTLAMLLMGMAGLGIFRARAIPSRR